MRAFSAAADDLFAPRVLQLVDDAEGGVRYWPRFVDAQLARRWFQQLHAHAAWTHLQRPMYQRIVDVPRLLAHYATDALPTELPLAEILQRVQAEAPAPYNRIGMNLYRDGDDSVAMHHDKLHNLQPGQPITLVSLGAPRRMLIRRQARGRLAGRDDTIAVDLAPGSLLRMSHASQLSHEHGIPKSRREQPPRISVVFRARSVD
ncbi:alpha-ketoglutarate-dependent dioxygenase AlkB [Pseudoxanthomonas dokdonensis]|uniref:DNA-3-methyladenine glycosylase n=1 Tax=Pseudoxanthomonas dokdonensis TaxID=344882 RepID=A0A0R0CFN6_9GAMM|nr:alpha-ketoglutarate-dependent dioxygenase AlkB [Pseudoxanthomonas dokdonensis]KRG68091.1 DNA-3-methyladenine glycosylase [Pseudoxanthomonas dokdonensis]